MSSVYSGGLVYEYSEEDSGYGLVKINGDSVTENEDFTELMNQFKSNPSPEGDDGYKSDGSASPCPANSPVTPGPRPIACRAKARFSAGTRSTAAMPSRRASRTGGKSLPNSRSSACIPDSISKVSGRRRP